MNTILIKPLIALATLAASHTVFAAGTVIVTSNQVAGNTLELYSSANNGKLTKISSISTGGIGTGGGLGSQAAIAYDEETHVLATVNAGSDSVSLFSTRGGTPALISTFPSGGNRPVSVALRGRSLFVLNQGDATHPSSLKGFNLILGGALAQESSVNLSQAGYVNPAQVKFSPSGRSLIVTEKATNKIDIFDLTPWGEVSSSRYADSAGMTPFGFEFDRAGRIFVSEAFGGAAGASALSSYRRADNGSLWTLTASAKTNQTAACWVALTPNGKYAFTTNAGSGTVSTFRIRNNGEVSLLGSSTPVAGAGPVDAYTSEDGKFLYVSMNRINMVMTYRIFGDGSLSLVDGGSAATLAGTAGLAVID